MISLCRRYRRKKIRLSKAHPNFYVKDGRVTIPPYSTIPPLTNALTLRSKASSTATYHFCEMHNQIKDQKLEFS